MLTKTSQLKAFLNRDYWLIHSPEKGPGPEACLGTTSSGAKWRKQTCLPSWSLWAFLYIMFWGRKIVLKEFMLATDQGAGKNNVEAVLG